jgi:simple sugar transport system permease protein
LSEEKPHKKGVLQVFLEEFMAGPRPQGSGLRRLGQTVLIPLLAVFSGLVLGGIFIILTSEQVYVAFRESVWAGLGASWQIVARSYSALFVGALGSPPRILAALRSGSGEAIRLAFNPFLESLVVSTPYILVGLGVALGFKANLFNIGAEGQLFVGALASAYVGYSITGLPSIIHAPLALLAGAMAGAVWGFIPGWLKAKTGGHEVINTMMMNYVAFRLSDYLLIGPMQRPGSGGVPISPMIQASATLPRLFPAPMRFHLGFFVALGIALLVYWFMFKTTWGFELRTVGYNPNAARYAGISIVRITILAMALSGALAATAGATQVLGVNHNVAMGLSSGYGFDSIALALLGKSHPLGVVLAALLFGTLRNGALQMEVVTGIPIDIISILQAVILGFIAAPAIIRTIYRLKVPAEAEEGVLTRGWGR